MAFRQPTAAPQRLSINRPQEDSAIKSPSLPSHPIDDSQEWVLFSPSPAGQSVTTSTAQATQTIAYSRLSDFGSLNTIPRSGLDEDELSDVPEDSDELDSLDDNLHTFREPSIQHNPRNLDQSGGNILPTHDGLGTFPPLTSPMQDQIWSHEKHNPQRRPSMPHRTLSSVHRRLDAVENEADEQPKFLDNNRMERIEQWRLDQSKILLEEFHKQKRKSESSSTSIAPSGYATGEPMNRRRSTRHGRSTSVAARSDSSTASMPEDESVWQRITRRVIRNLIGIDDDLLSIILGESLPEESVLSKTPTPSTTLPSYLSGHGVGSIADGWEDRLIRRLAKELGILVHQLSGTPTPLSTSASLPTMDYAGIPINHRFSGLENDREIEDVNKEAPEASAQFLPTLKNGQAEVAEVNQSSYWDANDADANLRSAAAAEMEYWEQTPDLKSMFKYLSQRFMSRRQSPPEASVSNIATAETPDYLRRAAIIRQHHPLVPRARKNNSNNHNNNSAHERTRGRRASLRSSHLHHHQPHQIGLKSPAAPPSLKRAGTSCASWSTKRNKLESDGGGSRNYWDIGGSIGSESIALGGVGAWGEV